MLRLPLPPSFSALLLPLLAAFSVGLTRAEPPSNPPNSTFAVEEIPFTAVELAQLFDYRPLGWRYHFSQEVYARLKVWDLPVKDGLSENADKTQPPTTVYPLREAADDFSLRILQHDEAKDASGQRKDPKVTTYKIVLQGRKMEDLSPERRDAKREVAAAFSSVLTPEEHTYGNNFFQTGVQQQFKEGMELVALSSSQVGPGVPLPNKQLLAKLAEGLSRPEGQQHLAEEKAKWQAYAEGRLLAEPVVVYRKVTRMAVSGDQNQTRGRAIFSVVLEFSHVPFEDDNASGENVKTKASTPTPGPSVSQ